MPEITSHQKSHLFQLAARLEKIGHWLQQEREPSPTVAPHFGHYGQPRSEGRRTTDSPKATVQQGLHAAGYMIGRIIALADDLQDVLAEMAQAVAASDAEEVEP